MDQERKTVAEFIEEHGLQGSLSVEFLGVGSWESLTDPPSKGDGGPVHYWRFTIRKRNTDKEFRGIFRTGAAWREFTESGARAARRAGLKRLDGSPLKEGDHVPPWYGRLTVAQHEAIHGEGNTRPQAPTMAYVMDSLRSDVSHVNDGQSFEEFAEDLGYDPDSRKAEGIYRACQKVRDDLRSLLGADALEALLECEPE